MELLRLPAHTSEPLHVLVPLPGFPGTRSRVVPATGKGQAFVHQVVEGHWPFTLGEGPPGAETWRENLSSPKWAVEAVLK